MTFDDRSRGIELENPADNLGVDLAPEQLALDSHAEGRDVDDGELARAQLADVDLHALDQARELQPRHVGQTADRSRDRDDEIGRIVLDIPPFDADELDLQRQPVRQAQAVAGDRIHAQEDAESRQGPERAIAQEGEVPAFAADREGANIDLGANGGDVHQLLTIAGAGVDANIAALEDDHILEVDAEGVDDELQVFDAAVLEFQGGADRLGIGIVGRLAVLDHGIDGPAGEELGPARGDEEGVQAEIHAAVKGDVQVLHPDPQVIEDDHVPEADIAAGLTVELAIAFEGFFEAVGKEPPGNAEAVVANDQRRLDNVVRGARPILHNPRFDHAADVRTSRSSARSACERPRSPGACRRERRGRSWDHT